MLITGRIEDVGKGAVAPNLRTCELRSGRLANSLQTRRKVSVAQDPADHAIPDLVSGDRNAVAKDGRVPACIRKFPSERNLPSVRILNVEIRDLVRLLVDAPGGRRD